MSTRWILTEVDEARLVAVAELVALKIKVGDVIALSGDLGAGKTTFARALIRAVLADSEAEVPSPTYSLVQIYPAPRLTLAHLDLYRLNDASESAELGIEELLTTGAVLVEWPERMNDAGMADRLDIYLSEGIDATCRNIEIAAQGRWIDRLARIQDIAAFLDTHIALKSRQVRYLQGDASARAYARIQHASGSRILMDWPEQPDGPPIRNGLPYSQIAHLAEGTRSFSSVQGLLAASGLRVPRIDAADHPRGLMLIEDLGDDVFAHRVARGHDMRPMWQAATQALVHIAAIDSDRIMQWNASQGRIAPIRDYDLGALEIEVSLLADWYWPLMTGAVMGSAVRSHFEAAWRPTLEQVLALGPKCLTLRDYHSPNLLWLEGAPQAPAMRVGLIDFQDALLGHPAFDLVSLLQDARVDVAENLESEMLDLYIRLSRERWPAFDEAQFRFAYAALGAQRNTKILGIFARLWKRDGKPQYLSHIPRLWRYLERDLAHPGMGALKAWYDAHFPVCVRRQAPNP